MKIETIKKIKFGTVCVIGYQRSVVICHDRKQKIIEYIPTSGTREYSSQENRSFIEYDELEDREVSIIKF